MRGPGGEWRNYAVEPYSLPIRYAPASVWEAMRVVRTETVMSLATATTAILGLSAASLVMITRRATDSVLFRVVWCRSVVWLVGTALLVAAVVAGTPTLFAVFLAGAILPVIVFTWWQTWQLTADTAPRPHMVWRAARCSTLGAVWIFLATWTPFVLWAYGIIPLHQLSLVVSVVLGTLSIAFCWQRVYTASQRATAAIDDQVF
jgi:hypothetical protein